MRVWVTGIGVVSPLAPRAWATMQALCEGRTAFREVSLFDPHGQRSTIAAEVPGLRVQDVAPREVGPGPWSRTDVMALLAGREALDRAGLDPRAHTVDLVMGSTTGATLETEESLPDLLRKAPPRQPAPELVDPLAVAVEHIASALGPFRRRRMVSSACSTGANAIAMAGAWIRSGRSERVLAGASDALCRLTFSGFNALGSLDREPPRPFDVTRNGLGLGEASAFVVLEREDVARARGADPIAELAGWSAGAEAHHITNPRADGLVAARIMRQALSHAGLESGDVDYLNAHGTATALNDPMEIRATRLALDACFDRTAISSLKGQIGHTLGAAGAVEAVVCALAIDQGRAPPTGGLRSPAEDCQANHVTGSARELPIRVALSNSFGFGGLDAVLVIVRPGYGPDPGLVHSSQVWVRGAALATPSGVHDANDGAPFRPDAPQRGPLGDDVVRGLDPSRSRRLGRAERLLASVVARTLGDGVDCTRTGLVVGKPSGRLDATARFMDRIQRRGPRFAPPAEFPNLMLSSLAGHLSIYHGLEGMTLATSSLSGAGSACLRTAWELLESGVSDGLVAGAVDPWGMASESGQPDRSEGAAALLLDSTRPEGPVVARLTLVEDAADLDPPATSPRVLLVGPADSTPLAASPWKEAISEAVEAYVGRHHAAGVAAVVLAAAWIAEGSSDGVVVVAWGDEGPVLVSVAPP